MISPVRPHGAEHAVNAQVNRVASGPVGGPVHSLVEAAGLSTSPCGVRPPTGLPTGPSTAHSRSHSRTPRDFHDADHQTRRCVNHKIIILAYMQSRDIRGTGLFTEAFTAFTWPFMGSVNAVNDPMMGSFTGRITCT